jgi:uncharacterized protein with beta-barrel porin domain
MQNIFSSFTRAIWQLVIGLFLLVSATFANAQSSCTSGPSYGYSTYFITEVGTSVTASVGISCNGVALANEPVEWQITNPSPGDSALPLTALSNASGSAQVNVQLGSTAGVRTLKFCIGAGGCSNLANSSATQPIYVFVTQCAPTIVNNTINVGGSATISANCTAVSDNTTTVTSTAYSWLAAPQAGAPLPNTTQGTATLTFPQAGNYTYTVLPTYTISINGSLISVSSFTAKARSPGVSVAVNAVNQPPTVSITAPINPGPYTAPATIDFTAAATAPGTTITSVDYLVNGVAINATPITTPPYGFSWTNRPAGIYTVTPRVVPAVGQPVVGTGVTVTVQDPPTIAIASPANGSGGVALSPITLTANVTSSAPVTKVEYFANKVSIGSAPSNAAPYTLVWTPSQPNSYDITAVVTNQVSPPVRSQAVTVLVTAPPVGSVACTVNSPSISASEGATLTAACTRNFRPLAPTLSADEVVRYDWVAAQAPGVPAGTTGDTLLFPAGSFAAGIFKYTVTATLTNRRFPTAATSSNTAEATITVKSKTATGIEVTSVPNPPIVTPGKPMSFTIVVLDGSTRLKGVPVTWDFVEATTKRASTKSALQKAGCSQATDVATSKSFNTDPNSGEGVISFTPSCATGGRGISVESAGFKKTILLRGPDELATNVVLSGASSVNAEPAKATPITVQVVDSNKLGIESVTTKWTIDPRNAGTVTETVTTTTGGLATTTLTLNAGVTKAKIEVCIQGNASGTVGKCQTIQVRNAITVVAEPGEAIAKPIMQQAIDAPRVQLNNIRNRLQQLRVEETASDGSDRKDSGAIQKTTGLGLFALGEVDFAKRQSGADTTYKLRTKGVTIGADYRAQKNLVIGGAFGALVGDTTLTGGSQKTKGYSASVFGQWLPAEKWYINAIANFGKNRIDNQRTSVSGDNLTGRGTTTQQAFQVESGYALAKDGARFTPFVRYEMIRAKLKPFEESGGADALAIGGQTVRANIFGFGAVGEYAISTSSGVWIPSGRVEFLSENQKQGAAYARLVNGTPVLVPLSPEAIDKSYGTWGLNLQWLTGPSGNLISSFIGYEQTFGKTGFKNNRFTAGVKIPF